MSQQINLLNPALIHEKDLIKTSNIAGVLSLLLVTLFGFYLYEDNALQNMIAARDHTAQNLSIAQERLKQETMKVSAYNDKTVLLNQIEALEQQENMQEAIVNAVNQKSDVKHHSYAAILRAFAKQSINGLWITGLSIDQGAQNLSISGRTVNAELVPKYISRLRAETVMQGKKFTDLRMQFQPKKVVKESPVAEKSTALASSNVTQGNKTEHTHMQDFNEDYIAFTLHSVSNNKGDKTAQVTAMQTNKIAGAIIE